MGKNIRNYICNHPFIVISIFIFLMYFYGICKINMISNTDEFSALAVPLRLSGYNIDVKATWHGYGFTILFTPFFCFFHSFTTIYKIMMCGMLLILSLYGYLIYRILNIYAYIDRMKAIIGGILGAIGAFAPYSEVPTSMMNEIPLSFIFVLTIYLIMKISLMEKHFFPYSVLCGIILAYCSIIHSRALVIYAAIFIAMLIRILLYREKKFFAISISVGISFLLSFLLFQGVNDIIISYVYAPSVNTLIDTKSIASNAKKIFEPYRWPFALKTFLCISANAALASGGLTVVGFIIGIIILWKGLHKKISANIFFLILVGILAFYGMNFLISLNSIGDITKGNYRWLSYIRYCRPFWGPLFIILFKYFIVDKMPNTKAITFFTISFLFHVFIVFSQLIPLLSNSDYGLNYNIFGHLTVTQSFSLDVGTFYKLFIKIILILFIILMVTNKGWKKCFVYMLFSLFINFDFQHYIVQYSINQEGRIDKSINIIEYYNETTEIYYYGNNAYNYRLALAAYESNIILMSDETDFRKDNTIYLSDSPKYIQDCEYVFQLDENEYIGVNNTIFFNNFEKLMELK